MKRRLVVLAVFCFLIPGSFGQQPPAKPPEQPAPTPAKAAKKRLVMNLAGFETVEASKMKPGQTSVGATRSGSSAEVVVLAPRLGRLYGSDALFAWQAERKATGFVVTIYDEHDAEMLRREVKEESLRLGREAGFQPGHTYYWSVQAQPQLMGDVEGEPVGFTVIPAEERARIGKELAGISAADAYQAGMARARIFADHRLWYDTIGCLTDLIARYPARAEAYELRGTVYAQLEVTKELSERDFTRADELAAQAP